MSIIVLFMISLAVGYVHVTMLLISAVSSFSEI